MEKENRGRVGAKVVSKKSSKIQRKVDRRHQQLQARQKVINTSALQCLEFGSAIGATSGFRIRIQEVTKETRNRVSEVITEVDVEK